jgi:hypothetical protein
MNFIMTYILIRHIFRDLTERRSKVRGSGGATASANIEVHAERMSDNCARTSRRAQDTPAQKLRVEFRASPFFCTSPRSTSEEPLWSQPDVPACMGLHFGNKLITTSAISAQCGDNARGSRAHRNGLEIKWAVCAVCSLSGLARERAGGRGCAVRCLQCEPLWWHGVLYDRQLE